MITRRQKKFYLFKASLILLFVVSGAIFLMSTNDLVSIFLSIELQSYGRAPGEAAVIEIVTEQNLELSSSIIGTIWIVCLSLMFAYWTANNSQKGIAEHLSQCADKLLNLDTLISEGGNGQDNELDTYREALLGLKTRSSRSQFSYGNFKVFASSPYSENSQEPTAHCSIATKHAQDPKTTTNVNSVQPRDPTAYDVNLVFTLPRRRSFHTSHTSHMAKGNSRTPQSRHNPVSNIKDPDEPNLAIGGKSVESVSTWLITEISKYLKHNGKHNGLINIISDVTFLKFCYLHLKSRPGNMSEGTNHTTLDGISDKWFSNISNKLVTGKFDFSPTRRVMIPKPGKKAKRPLSIGNPREKIIQQAIFMVLENIWDSIFSGNSYGFRPNRNLQQALYHLYRNGSPYSWVIQGDISKCFDLIPHEIIMKKISEKISCDKTISLIRKSLTAGHIDPDTGKHIRGSIGTPQGNILSPLLANIVLNDFDSYMDDLKQQFDKGIKRARNKEYDAITSKIAWIQKSQPGSPLIKKLAAERRTIPSTNVLDPNFKRLMYLRYADDFVILLIGTKDEAKLIKHRIADILLKRCGLHLNDEKTLITATKEGFKFLGTWCVKPSSIKAGLFTNKRGNPTKSRMRMRIELPVKDLYKKLVANKFAKYDEQGLPKATARRDLVNLTHWEILNFYNSRIKGLAAYYAFAANYNSLRSIVMTLQFSCALTLALKYKLRTKRTVFSKYGRFLKDPETGIKLYIPSDFKTRHTFAKGSKIDIDKALKISWAHKVTKSVLHAKCAICNTQANVEMHHIRKVKDVRHKIRTGNSTYQEWVGTYNRKQVPLCGYHHDLLHAGDLTPFDMSTIRKFNG